MRPMHVIAWLAPLLLLLAGCRTTDAQTETSHPVGGEACDACHLGAYESALFDHASVDFDRDCKTCHTEVDWRPKARPPHFAGFPLKDAHQVARCEDCHAAGRENPQPATCIGCHAADKTSARADHTDFSDDCTTCHAGSAWKPTDLDHDPFFPLVGQHVLTPCASCHEASVFSGTSRLCVDCHADASPARHVAPSFSSVCSECHTPAAWLPPGPFDHEPLLPLTGAHMGRACADCHDAAPYDAVPDKCVGCHAEDRAAAADPRHTGISDTCKVCHTTTAWRPSTFDHNTRYAREGRHAVIDCEACHDDDRYVGTPTACVECHESARDLSATSHAGFTDDCTTCHTQDAWTPVAHLRFFVPHADISACDDCHPDRSDFSAFTCVECHSGTHARASTDARHVEVGDYSYDNQACYRCHRDGRGD